MTNGTEAAKAAEAAEGVIEMKCADEVTVMTSVDGAYNVFLVYREVGMDLNDGANGMYFVEEVIKSQGAYKEGSTCHWIRAER